MSDIDIIQHIHDNYEYVVKFNAYRTKKKTRPWLPQVRQEYIDTEPLWERAFERDFSGYNGKIKLPYFENIVNNWKKIMKTPVVANSKQLMRKALVINKFYEEGLRSARLDPRLTPITVRTKPSFINIPSHAMAILSKSRDRAFTVATWVAISSTVASVTPELTPYLDEISPVLRHHMLFTGSAVLPALMYVLSYWRKYVSAPQKERIKKIKELKAELEAMRTRRASVNQNAILNSDIVKIERELQEALDVAFAKAYFHGLPKKNIG